MSKSIGRFGGFGLDRMLADYEAVIDDTTAADAPADIDAGTEPPEAPEAAETQPEALEQAAAAAGIDLSDPAIREQLAQIAADVFHGQAQPQADAPTDDGQQPFELDPFSETFGQDLAQLIRNTVLEANAPITQRFDAEQQTADNERVNEAVLAEIGRAGGFTEALAPKVVDPIRRLAETFMLETVGVYGQTPRAAEAAISKAAGAVRDLIAEATAAGVEKERAGLANLTGADREIAGGGSGVVRPVQGGDELDVARRWGAV